MEIQVISSWRYCLAVTEEAALHVSTPNVKLQQLPQRSKLNKFIHLLFKKLAFFAMLQLSGTVFLGK